MVNSINDLLFTSQITKAQAEKIWHLWFADDDSDSDSDDSVTSKELGMPSSDDGGQEF